ncbi:MAG: DNA primase DnaG [Candidatus Woesearchaeota archaeon]|jgi:DNA primase
MAKISQVTNKYIVTADITIDGTVDRPDVIGAIFGQTEGLLGADLELRELQRSGRIGRIEVMIETKGAKSAGTITIPSSLDKAETAIIAASLEIIQRIGPCNAEVKVKNIEDVRVMKRKMVLERAKELLKTLTDSVLPDSQELAEEVSASVRVAEITEWGPDKLPCGPIDENEELIIVEGRADVINMLKNGFKNVIAMNGANIPPSLIELAKKKTTIAFVDGDRGGDLNLKSLLELMEIDFVTRAPDGKEVEELAKKEIHKALRGKITAEQARLDFENNPTTDSIRQRNTQRPEYSNRSNEQRASENRERRPMPPQQQREQRPTEQREFRPTNNEQRAPPQSTGPDQRERPQKSLTETEKAFFSEMLESLVGTRAANILDKDLNVLGKVPVSELNETLESLEGVFAVVFDGVIGKDIVAIAKTLGMKFLVANESEIKPSSDARCRILTANYFKN